MGCNGGEDVPDRKWVGDSDRDTTKVEFGGGGAPDGANRGGEGEK